MATVSKEIADEIIAHEGRYPGDPLVIKIVRYENQFNGEYGYGLVYEGEDPHRYHTSPACINPQTIWEWAKDTA